MLGMKTEPRFICDWTNGNPSVRLRQLVAHAEAAEKTISCTAPFGHGSVGGCEHGTRILSRAQRKRLSATSSAPSAAFPVAGVGRNNGNLLGNQHKAGVEGRFKGGKPVAASVD